MYFIGLIHGKRQQQTHGFTFTLLRFRYTHNDIHTQKLNAILHIEIASIIKQQFN